ncbi:MAG: hypothetical protein NTZ72_14620 [Afipia sp.]|nr:hypothetical protein [Afipia sp.]
MPVKRGKRDRTSDITDQAKDASSLDRKWAQLAVFGTVVSLLIATGYCLLRMGLSTPVMLIPACVTIVAASLFAPLLLPRQGLLAELENRAVVLPLVTLAILVGIFLAFFLGRSLLVIYFILAVSGFYRAVRLLRHGDRPALLSILAIALVVAAYLFITVHNLGYAGVLSNEQSQLGLLNHDTRFHAAIAFMIQNFGIPSTAVDGVLPLKYHFGSHIWFAALGILGVAEPAASYGAAVPIVAAPMLVFSLLLAAMAIDHARKSVIDYLIVGLALIFLSDCSEKSYYISESYTFGLIGTLLLLPLLARLANIGASDGKVWFGIFVAIAAIPILLSFKISAGLLWTVGFGWIVLRRFAISKETAIVGAVTLAVLLASVSIFAPGPNDYNRMSNSAIVPFYYLRFDPTLGSLTSLIGPLCLAFFCVAKMPFRQLVRSRSDLMLEAILLVTIVGAIPAMIGVPQDSSVWYFLNVGQWYAFAILAARISVADLSQFTLSPRRDRLFVPVATVVVFAVGCQMARSITPAFFDTYRGVIRAADKQVDGQLLKGRSVTQYFADTLKKERVLFGADFKAAMSAAVGPQLISMVRDHIDTRSPDNAVFIPPQNLAYWDFQAICRDKHNIQTALTGQPSLLGGPPASYNCPKDAYTTPYGNDFAARDITDADLCAHARTRKIKTVYVLNDVRAATSNKLLRCDK